MIPLVHRFVTRAQEAPDALAFAVYARGDTRASASMTWGAWYEASRALAVHLLHTGVAAGDRVAILAPNRPLWPIADLALQMIGAIGVGIFPGSAASQIEALIADSGARLTITADETVFDAMMANGRALLATDDTSRDVLDARLSAVRLDDLAAIIYTSGSTGIPKGACLSHRYLAASAVSIVDVLGLTAADRVLSFLPFSHAAERVFGQCTRLLTGMSAALIEDPTDVFPVAADFEPTLLGGLPRIFERLHEAVEVARRDGADPKAAIAARIGRHCRLATSGGAAMPVDVAEQLAELGLPIVGAYGQTEHLCIAMNRPSRVRFDTVGEPMPGTTVRIADDGELLVARGPLTFSGYWGKAEETRAAFTDDGAWLHTGDRAEQAPDGSLRITGRLKEILALSNGRKVAPAPIEAALNASPFIAHAVCHGEGRRFLSALLSPRQTVVEAWARREGIETPWPALLTHPQVQAVFTEAVSRVNRDLARTDRVQRFVVIEHELSVEDGTLTPTLKVMRHVIADRFAPLFDALYARDAEPQTAGLAAPEHSTRNA